MSKAKVGGNVKKKERKKINCFPKYIQMCRTWEKWESFCLENPGQQMGNLG